MNEKQRRLNDLEIADKKIMIESLSDKQFFLTKLEKLNPQPGEGVIIWTSDLSEKQVESINEWVGEVKKHFPFVIFLVIPSDNIIEKLDIHGLKSLMEQLDQVKDKLESTLLQKS